MDKAGKFPGLFSPNQHGLCPRCDRRESAQCADRCRTSCALSPWRSRWGVRRGSGPAEFLRNAGRWKTPAGHGFAGPRVRTGTIGAAPHLHWV